MKTPSSNALGRQDWEQFTRVSLHLGNVLPKVTFTMQTHIAASYTTDC